MCHVSWTSHDLSVTQIITVSDRFDLIDNDGSLFSQAAQILLGFFHCALGILCECLFIREAGLQRVGYIPTFVMIIYAFWSAPYVSKRWYY